MTGACFVVCPNCDRLMIGQHVNGTVYPQPHQCVTPEAGDE